MIKKVRGQAIVFMDNYMVHQTQRVKDLFTDRVEQRFLPPYSCALNPIERLWSVVKNEWRKQNIINVEGMSEDEAEIKLRDILNSNQEKAKSIARSHVQSLIRAMEGHFV
jgi:transposase